MLAAGNMVWLDSTEAELVAPAPIVITAYRPIRRNRTGASDRVSASYQGLFGIRPTHGDVPVDSLVALALAFDTVGWLAELQEDLHEGADVLEPDLPDWAEGFQSRQGWDARQVNVD